MRTIPAGRYYLDANVFIYAVENHPRFSLAARHVLSLMGRDGRVGVTSELTLAEILVKPLRDGKSDQVQIYGEMVVNTGALEVLGVSRSLLRVAAEIRACSVIKLADAIHIATARLGHCTMVVTEDARLRSAALLAAMSLHEIGGA
ncbi:MAG: PIN domain-containing protein [Hyphomicrobium aestuarii]|nr:PIN domain-containing protein [Hyphomicrobium aestuarii]